MPDPILTLNTPSHLTERLGLSLAHAFNDAPDYRFILACHPDRVSALSWFFGTFIARLALRYGAVLSTDVGTGGILLLAPGQSPSLFELLRAGALSLPRFFGIRGAWRAFFLGLHLERRRLQLAPVPHWYVIAVGVTPSLQGRGNGVALLNEALQRADNEQTPCYLEVFEPELVTRYERMGFRVLQQDQLAGGLTLWCMLRMPAASSNTYHHCRFPTH
ncbi:MAG TPA: GNAT family N-acetyltransferase [Dongiaceae bacterium]|nr:GNAT family N-acetyltransferase [Dongiaceae bacterium]